ncbi:hypothetical protein HDV62DRAFT_73862 [Trichoderma sp. SZMC 28011]
MPLDWPIRTCFVRNQCRPLQRSPPRFSIWRYPHAILRRIEKLQRRPASYGLVSPISTKHLASSTLPASGGLNDFFLFESTCLCLLSLSRLYGCGACSVKSVLFFFFFHFPFYFAKFSMALPSLKLARRPRWRRPISTRLHMQQTRDVAVLFYTRVECVVSMFPPFHMDLLMADNLARCCQSSTFSCLLFRFHNSEPRCLCAGGMAMSAVTTYHQQEAELARSHKMPGPLTRTRKLNFLTKSWPPQTPFHPTLVPQFPVPTEPCTRDWLAFHHRLSHWRLRRYE